MIELEYFFDVHCHLFSVADVPFLRLIDSKRDELRHPLYLLLAPLAAVLPLIPRKYYFHFVSHFDSEVIQNAENTAAEVAAAHGMCGFKAEKSILTPLIMDFDIDGGVTKFEAQAARLKAAAEGCGKIKILPFIGIDPRRFIHKAGQFKSGEILKDEVIKQNLSSFLNSKDHLVKDYSKRRDPDALQNGDFIGAKVYPPLGFDILPPDPKERQAHMAVYWTLNHLKIPITVHCQKNSFELTSDHNQAVTFNDPSKWSQVMSDNEGELRDLRINFAHFGGDDGVADLMDFSNDGPPTSPDYNPQVCGYQKRGWTYDIIKMLKKYPNTYADVSAYDYKDHNSASFIMWALAFDKAGQFNELGEYQLIDKLLWGSDRPMILTGYADYCEYLTAFTKAMRCDGGGVYYRKPPKTTQVPSMDEICRKLMCENPLKFLFDKP